MESLSFESLSVESLCVLGGGMASRRRCSTFCCDTCSGAGDNDVLASVMVTAQGVPTPRIEPKPPTLEPSPKSAATCLRNEETSASTLEICTLASTKAAALTRGETFKSGRASNAAIAGGRSALDRATDAGLGGGRDSGSKSGPVSDDMLNAWGGPISRGVANSQSLFAASHHRRATLEPQPNSVFSFNNRLRGYYGVTAGVLS